MSSVAFIRRCVAAGMPMDMALVAAEAFEAEVKIAVDDVLEPRRARDRERKARAPRNSAESVESAEFQERPLSRPLPPQTPLTPTHSPGDISTREGKAREDAAFGRFWIAYPRKTAKADARKAFAKAWRKLPPTDEELILSGGLERAKAGWDDPQFIPHAATWLNQERWTDELPAPCTTPRKAHDRPHHDPKFDARQANLARAFAGADRAAGQRWKP